MKVINYKQLRLWFTLTITILSLSMLFPGDKWLIYEMVHLEIFGLKIILLATGLSGLWFGWLGWKRKLRLF